MIFFLLMMGTLTALAPLEPPEGKILFGPWYERLNGDNPVSINQRLNAKLPFFQSDFNLTDDCQPKEIDIFFNQIHATDTNAIAYMTIYPIDGFHSVTEAALQTLTLKIVEAVNKGIRIFIRYASEMNGNWFSYGQRPLDFLNSWKWVVGTIRNATNNSQNIAFIWAPNSGNGYPFPLGKYFISQDSSQFYLLDTNNDQVLDINDDPYSPYYPGDDWVDWVGFSIYHYGKEYPWEQNVLPPPGKFEAIMIGDLAYNATFHFYEMFSGSGIGGAPQPVSKGGKPFIVTETGSTFHLAKLDNNYWYSLDKGPGRVAIKQAWWRQYLNSTFLDTYPKLKGVCTFEFTKFEETTWRDFASMGDTGTGINSPFGNDAGAMDGPVLNALKQDLASLESRIIWASPTPPGSVPTPPLGKYNLMKSFSSAIISDSQPCTNPMLPAWTASVGWGLGILLGSAIGIHRIVNSDIALSGLLLCFEIFLHYTLCTARDPKSTDLSCLMEPLNRNYLIFVALLEGLYWRNIPLKKTGIVLVIMSIILRSVVYCMEYLSFQTKKYLKRTDLENVIRDQVQLNSLLIKITFLGWIGHCLILNGVFSGLYFLWLLLSDQILVEAVPKLTIPVQNMTLISFDHTRQSVFHRASFLGLFTGLGIVMSVLTSLKGLGVYIAFLSIFHFLEYVCIAVNSTQVTLSAFLLNHSPEYTFATFASLLEYAIEWYLFPSLKSWNWMTNVAIVLCLLGQFIRSLAMLTAKSNFTHLVRITKVSGHELVKTGIYKYFRHPSYTGFFYWAIALQIILMNPLCLVAYIKILSKFFSDRIVTEETALIDFFGKEYRDYRKTTYILIPEI